MHYLFRFSSKWAGGGGCLFAIIILLQRRFWYQIGYNRLGKKEVLEHIFGGTVVGKRSNHGHVFCLFFFCFQGFSSSSHRRSTFSVGRWPFPVHEFLIRIYYRRFNQGCLVDSYFVPLATGGCGCDLSIWGLEFFKRLRWLKTPSANPQQRVTKEECESQRKYRNSSLFEDECSRSDTQRWIRWMDTLVQPYFFICHSFFSQSKYYQSLTANTR